VTAWNARGLRFFPGGLTANSVPVRGEDEAWSFSVRDLCESFRGSADPDLELRPGPSLDLGFGPGFPFALTKGFESLEVEESEDDESESEEVSESESESEESLLLLASDREDSDRAAARRASSASGFEASIGRTCSFLTDITESVVRGVLGVALFSQVWERKGLSFEVSFRVP
jgi:hypothetical protein